MRPVICPPLKSKLVDPVPANSDIAATTDGVVHRIGDSLYTSACPDFLGLLTTRGDVVDMARRLDWTWCADCFPGERCRTCGVPSGPAKGSTECHDHVHLGNLVDKRYARAS